jgi:hypothetical protein
VIFRRVILNDGRLCEYRQAPAYRLFRAVNRWFWFPRPFVAYAQRFALQRRINGGPWQRVGGVR